jgi:hypothetical protein
LDFETRGIEGRQFEGWFCLLGDGVYHYGQFEFMDLLLGDFELWRVRVALVEKTSKG